MFVSHQDEFEAWDRDVQNLYLSELERELETCRHLASKPKVVNAEAHVTVRFGPTPIIE